MTNLMPSSTIVTEAVRKALLDAATGKGSVPCFLTAYQILSRLPEGLRAQLIAERGRGGKGAAVYYAAPSVVSDAAERLPGIEVQYLDTGGLKLIIEGHELDAGSPVCGLYRLRPNP
jgi:hypothetical protein